MYLILDLPTERREDYDQWTGLLEKLESIPDAENFTLFPSPNVFIPTPHTPMQWFGIHPFGEHRKWWRYAMRGEDNNRIWKFKVAMRDTAFGAAKRVKTMLAVRGNERAAQTMWNLVTNRPAIAALNKLTQHEAAREILRMAARGGITEDELLGELPTSQPLPWDFIHTYFRQDDPDHLKRYYEKIKERAIASLTDARFIPLGMGEKIETLTATGEEVLLDPRLLGRPEEHSNAGRT